MANFKPVGLAEPDLALSRDGRWTFVDTRKPELYGAARLPNAVNLYGMKIQTSDPLEIADMLAPLGLYGAHNLMLYDDGSGLGTGPVLWALERGGREWHVSILNGGFSAWAAKGLPIEKGKPTPTTDGASRPEKRAEAPYDNLATKEWVLANLDNENVVLIDSRSEGEYTGRQKEAKRNGHIPGAERIEWSELVYTDENKITRFRDLDEIRAMMIDRGITPEKEIACYCQIGIRSAQVYMALRLAGYQKARNYLRSWAEWGNDPSTPIAVPSAGE